MAARIGSVFGAQLVTIMVMPIVLYFSVNQNGGAGDPTGWFAFACIGDATKFSFRGIINVVIGLVAVALFPVLTTKFSRRKLFIASIVIMVARARPLCDERHERPHGASRCRSI